MGFGLTGPPPHDDLPSKEAMVTRTDDNNVEVELVGCSGLGSHFTAERSAVAEGRLKIQFGAGYEHFDFDHFAEAEGEPIPVFIWTDRTWIAE